MDGSVEIINMTTESNPLQKSSTLRTQRKQKKRCKYVLINAKARGFYPAVRVKLDFAIKLFSIKTTF